MALRLLAFALLLESAALAHPQARHPISAPVLHAHNCYPEAGQWADRVDRALATGLRPIAIEQDLVWFVDASGHGRSLVAHEAPATGMEPAFEDHFFHRFAPMLDAALASPRPDTWPLVILHLDFKTNEAAHHRAVWELLGRYERWLTTAPKTAADDPQPFAIGPLLVLTENGDGQSANFYDRLPRGARLRLFGTVPSPRLTTSDDREVQRDASITAAPEVLLPTRPTNYRRWANFSWAVVERGGPELAGAWTPVDERRLQAIVKRAHERGLWIRFYTLNGHSPGEGLGWSASYNFGSLDAVRPRWRAAVAAGVDFIATDQYEGLADVLKEMKVMKE